MGKSWRRQTRQSGTAEDRQVNVKAKRGYGGNEGGSYD
ncbi:hypothetical protein COLO4_12063 [Corchorus olitorius]|uniref:Uncharacterized protein n=1 Tax=Corchorus olitorius TaxID=93759 RepID=A0A1R3K2K5_9ROSI|nr:hypothetical protein COLO4_12063 [Corchorus olitorius]